MWFHLRGATPTLFRTHIHSLPGGLARDCCLGHCNFDAGYCDPSDPWDMSRARLVGLGQYARGSYAEGERLLFLAPVLGLRNSRLIKGKYRITFHDQLRRAEFDDVVGYTYSHYDNHACDYENESLETMLWVWGHGQLGHADWLRDTFPLHGAGGRPKSAGGMPRDLARSRRPTTSLRMMRDMQRLGEVAGIAAALARKTSRAVQEIDVKELQAELFKAGALKDQEHGYHWKWAGSPRSSSLHPTGSS